MRTTFHTRQPYADMFLQIAKEFQNESPAKPTRFMKLMETNQGSVTSILGGKLAEDGLEPKNPVIVGLGDSVTAGHFESLITMTPQELMEAMKELMKNPWVEGERQQMDVEITDARESYLEKFRFRLIDKYERTSVSTINAGIAGDNLIQMSKRLDRDVIRYQPDLVLINGSLNWDAAMGTAEEYKEILRGMVRRVKNETTADIILLTPNGDLPNRMFFGDAAPQPTTLERVVKIRELAAEEEVCLADVYAVWELARENKCPWEELLANRVNHPSVEGHEVYAEVLMKLFE